jgi:hypothetical protein
LILAYTKWCSYVEAGIPPSTTASGFKAASNPLSNPIGLAPNVFDEVLKATPPALISFLANLPVVEGNYSDFNTIYILVKIFQLTACILVDMICEQLCISLLFFLSL